MSASALFSPSENQALQSFFDFLDCTDTALALPNQDLSYLMNSILQPPPTSPSPSDTFVGAHQDGHPKATHLPHTDRTAQLTRATRDLIDLGANQRSSPAPKRNARRSSSSSSSSPLSPLRPGAQSLSNHSAQSPTTLRAHTHSAAQDTPRELQDSHLHKRTRELQHDVHVAKRPRLSPASSSERSLVLAGPSQPPGQSLSLPLPPESQPRARSAQTRTAPLSASQKKAHHIQAEHRRRANIRRGYEALCDVVPALREAIRAAEVPAASGSRRKRASPDDEKSDGRAGPKSEGVVLQKTIEHITALLDERTALLARLQNARAALPPGHPALAPLAAHCKDQPGPPWERVWDGGEGLMGDVEADDSESDNEA